MGYFGIITKCPDYAGVLIIKTGSTVAIVHKSCRANLATSLARETL